MNFVDRLQGIEFEWDTNKTAQVLSRHIQSEEEISMILQEIKAETMG